MSEKYKFCGYCDWFYYNDIDDGYMAIHYCKLHEEKDVNIDSAACFDFEFDGRFNQKQKENIR